MKKLKLFFACLLMAVLSIGQVWAVVESGTTYNTDPKTPSVPTGWTVSSYANDQTYTKLASSDSYIQTDEFCQNGFTSIKIKARKFGGPSAAQAVISVEWFENGGSSTVLATVSPTGTSLTDYTLSELESVTGNKSGYIKISCKEASGGKGCGVSQVTITYTAGTCGGGTPTCATPTFLPAAGSYEGTQNVTISSTADATIYYTTDGNTPSASSSVYTSPIAVSADMTIKAYAVKAGYDDSEVAEAAYTITEGPDVTLDLIDGNWGFPTSNTTVDGTYTNSVSGYSVTCHAPTNYKVSGSDYFFIGKSGAYILLPEFANPIEKIVVVGNSGCSASVVFNIFDGDDAASTAVTGGNVDRTFMITNPEANKQYTLKVTSAHNLQLKAIKIYFGAAPAVNKPTISGDEAFVTSTSVSMSCTTTGAAIYYTLDGSDPQLGGATLYEGSFSLTEDATVNARAKLVDDWSGMVSKTFTKVTALSTMAEVQAAATTTTDQPINVAISNWVVTAVSGGQAWIADADNAKGILLYKSGHGFEAGKKINGTVVGTKIKLYNLFPELTSLLASEVTVTDAEAVSPRSVTIPTLISNHPAEQGTIVKLDNVTYTSSMLSDGVNTIAADNKFFSSLALVEGTTYNITGVVTYYKNGDDAVVKIAPRSAADVEATSEVVTPTAANLAALKAAERGTYILTLTNAVVTYVNGNNAFIEDATGGALIYFANHGYSAGDCLNGDYQVVTTDYQGKFEITAMEPQAGAAKTTAEIPLTTVSIATLNADFSSYESRRVKIVGANVTDAIKNTDRNGAINDGAALAVYAAVASTITLNADDNVDIIGYPGFHNTDQQLNVWRQEDITVNVKEDPELAYDPVSETITGGDPWSAPTFDNPHSLTVTFSSDNDAVATVDPATGEITLEGGYGTAVITAHSDADATYNAGNATYTITVNDPASVDTRKVANSPATFTTTNGNLDPADIAYASYQGGSSTAPAIYNDGIRLYQIGGSNDFGGFITLTAKAGCTIDEVQITTTSKYATTVAYSKDGNENLLKSESVSASGSYTTGTGLNVSSVNILNLGTGSSGRLEIASIKVYYTGEAATIDHYELGGTYQTAFMQDEEFNHSGLIVYAAYDALGELKVDITSMCTFSEPDMSTTGEKTIEITYNEAVVISYTINVAADSRKVAESPATFTAVSGDMVPADITFASYKGGASNDPYLATGGIRLYQINSTNNFGGFITLKAKKGCTIDQVKITTSAEYATTVAYSVDGNENLLGSESVAKSSSYTTPAGLNVESVNILNLGTGSSGRLEIASIKVWYTGSALSVDHYILGGTYATEFEQFGTFNYEGLTVTAAYDELETITEAVTGFTVEADLSTAGAKKANVMLNSVKIAEYDITVNASAKEDPALAYIPASVVLTLGDALSAPTFSNTHNVSPISYNSDKPAVATVDAEGNIALAGGTGVAVITASFAGDEDYIESEATFTITVNEPAEDLTGPWTLASTVAVGDKIIIMGANNADIYTMGKQNTNNRAAVASTLDGDVLTPGAATKVFTLVDAGEGKFAIQASNGNYLTSATSGTSNNLLEAADYDLDNAKWTISIEEGVASIVAAAGSKTVMQYNSGSTIFSCYGSASQKPVKIFKRGAAPEPTKDLVRDGLGDGKWGTLCPAQTVENVEGAVFYQISYLEEKDGEPFNMVFDQIEGTTLTAGQPYFFIASANEIRGNKTGVVLDAAGTGVNGFYGYIGTSPMDLSWRADYDVNYDNTYVIYNNSVFRITGDTQLKSERCYININDSEPIRTSVPAPGRKRLVMRVDSKGTPQGFESIEASEKPMKLMINGQMYILRGEKMYDATGRLVK